MSTKVGESECSTAVEDKLLVPFGLMDILFLAHCVPNPPNKGERIRAHQEITALTNAGHRVHLVCVARSDAEARYAADLRDRCSSVYVDKRSFVRALVPAAV